MAGPLGRKLAKHQAERIKKRRSSQNVVAESYAPTWSLTGSNLPTVMKQTPTTMITSKVNSKNKRKKVVSDVPIVTAT